MIPTMEMNIPSADHHQIVIQDGQRRRRAVWAWRRRSFKRHCCGCAKCRSALPILRIIITLLGSASVSTSIAIIVLSNVKYFLYCCRRRCCQHCHLIVLLLFIQQFLLLHLASTLLQLLMLMKLVLILLFFTIIRLRPPLERQSFHPSN